MFSPGADRGPPQWVTAFLTQPYKIATKNTRTALVLFFMAKTALMLPNFGEGAPLGNVSLEGRAASSKSFHFQIVALTHLVGATMNIAHISQVRFHRSTPVLTLAAASVHRRCQQQQRHHLPT